LSVNILLHLITKKANIYVMVQQISEKTRIRVMIIVVSD